MQIPKIFMKKYIFVTGGVASSLGKGIISASIAKLLQARGYSVAVQKFDPYINVLPGLLNPHEHGECFVTDDGAETDLDLGHYERFTNVPTSQANSVTTGRIYRRVMEQEASGEFKGKTIQVIPHITNEIKRRVYLLGEERNYDIIITEIGGTVGDMESLPYIEAVRQLRWELDPHDIAVVHLTLVPYLSSSGELKTKPTQHSVKLLQELGIQPDVLVLRTEHPILEEVKKKVALFCNVDPKAVVESLDVPTIYQVPLMMQDQELDATLLEKLGEPVGPKPDMTDWKAFLSRIANPKHTNQIGLVGKYCGLPDAYKSIQEAFVHAGSSNECKVVVNVISSETITSENASEKLAGLDGIIVPSGFGNRGFEGKVITANYARIHKIPFLGIGFGFQASVIAFAREELGFKDANSTELNPQTHYPVVTAFSPETGLELPMRVGQYSAKLAEESILKKVYSSDLIHERHRHKYEINKELIHDFEKKQFVISAVQPESGLIEAMEYKPNPFYVGVLFNPEYKSTVVNPHPLFVAFVKASMK